MAYANRVDPPNILQYQNVTGIMDFFARSLTSHCKMKRHEKKACPIKPITSQRVGVFIIVLVLCSFGFDLVVALSHGILHFINRSKQPI